LALQNRVNPFGEILATDARGMFTGNRGVIHDPDSKTLLPRRWTTKAWIICVCDFRGRKRDVMGRNSPSGGAGWTELFFLDEVTALAAGHRPCFYCRRERAKAFAAGFGNVAKAREIDAVLHAERRASAGKPAAMKLNEVLGLPDGAMVELDGKALALLGDKLLPWTFHGYDAAIDIASAESVFRLVTPQSTVSVLRNGYTPVWHGSAQA